MQVPGLGYLLQESDPSLGRSFWESVFSNKPGQRLHSFWQDHTLKRGQDPPSSSPPLPCNPHVAEQPPNPGPAHPKRRKPITGITTAQESEYLSAKHVVGSETVAA